VYPCSSACEQEYIRALKKIGQRFASLWGKSFPENG
jgi:hypothetical protein